MGKLGLQKRLFTGYTSYFEELHSSIIHFIHNVYDISYRSIRGVSKQIHVWYKNKHMS